MSTNLFGGETLETEDYSAADRGDDIPSLEDLLVADTESAVVVPDVEPPALAPEPDADPAAESGAADPETESEPDTGESFIPRARFNDINDKRKAAEQRARELENRLAQSIPASDYDFESREREYMDAVLEGDHTKALSLRRDIRAAEMELARSVAAVQAQQAKESTKAELEFEQTIALIEADYPVFDQSNAAYNQELVDEALELHAGFISRGYSPAAAMRKATQYVAKANDLAPRSAVKPLAPARKTPAVSQSKLDMAAAQPPVQGGISGGEVEPDYSRLSDAEWDALPAATVARLRGDLF